jgi:hypothetical protein
MAMTTPTRPHQIVFYNHDRIVVTDAYFAVDGYPYQIRRLSNLMQIRGSLHPGAVVGLVTAAAEAVAIALLVSVVRVPAMATPLAAIALVIPCVVGLFCAHRWPPQRELLAHYKGVQVILVASRNELEFNQIVRALQRAIEARRPSPREPVGPPADPWAGTDPGAWG